MSATTVSDAPRSLIYVDTSAFVKLLFAEPESEALRRWLAGSSGALIASALLEVELSRAVVRAQSDGRPAAAGASVEALLVAVDLIDLSDDQLKYAAALPDSYLRTLDAIHLAAAFSVEGQLSAIVTYDLRMIQAAKARRLTVASPA